MHDLIQALLFAYYIDFSCVYNKTVTYFLKKCSNLSVLPASAFGAEDWMAKAKVIQPDKEYSFTLPDNTSETVDYKIDMKFPGYLVLDVSSTADETRFDWCSETNDHSNFNNYKSTKGSALSYSYSSDSYLKWDSNAKNGIGSFSQELPKGTYYLRFWRGGNYGSGKVKFTARFYSTNSSLGNYKNAPSGKTYTSDMSVEGDERV